MIFSCFQFYRKYVGANRMSAVKQGNAVLESYAYNHRGERVLRTPTGGTAQITLYDEAGQWLGNYSASVADYVRDTQGRTSGDVMRGGFPSNPTPTTTVVSARCAPRWVARLRPLCMTKQGSALATTRPRVRRSSGRSGWTTTR